jgi:DNA-binding NarL/FixJ family response regulator
VVGKGGTILIADGDGESRAVATRALQRAGYTTLELKTGAAALEAARAEDVALLLLEITLPDMTGYEVCRTLREELGDDLPIFFLSGTHTTSVDVVGGLLHGADDFIFKPFDADELVARVRRFVTRATVAKRRREDTSTARLTGREREVLTLLAAGVRQKEIAMRLSISVKTVGTHIQNLLGKLEVHSRAELVARAYMLGLISMAGGDRRSRPRHGTSEPASAASAGEARSDTSSRRREPVEA